MLTRKSIALGLMVASAAALSIPAQAALIVGDGNPGQGENVLSNGCTAANEQGPANPVSGCLNQDRDILVLFEGDEDLTYTGGQAVLEADDGGFSYVRIFVPGYLFSYIEFNIDALEDGDVIFSSNLGDFPVPQSLDGNGENRFSLYGDAGEMFEWIAISAANVLTNPPGRGEPFDAQNIVDIKQVRLTVEEVPVPATGTLAVLGAGLLGLAFVRRRKVA